MHPSVILLLPAARPPFVLLHILAFTLSQVEVRGRKVCENCEQVEEEVGQQAASKGEKGGVNLVTLCPYTDSCHSVASSWASKSSSLDWQSDLAQEG